MVSPIVPVARLISCCWSSNTNSYISRMASPSASEVPWKLSLNCLLPGRPSLQQPATVRKSTARNSSNRCCNRHREEPGYVCLFSFILFFIYRSRIPAVIPEGERKTCRKRHDSMCFRQIFFQRILFKRFFCRCRIPLRRSHRNSYIRFDIRLIRFIFTTTGVTTGSSRTEVTAE